MNYRIRRADGVGETATLAELRARREEGRLSGSELVQAEGTLAWVRLDMLLQPTALPPLLEPPVLPPAVPPPLLAPRPAAARPRRIWPAVVAAAIVLGLFFGGSAYFLWRHYRPLGAAVTGAGAPVARGVELAARPIAVAATPTEADVEARMRRFWSRQWLEGYRQRGRHHPTAQAADEKFIRVHIDRSLNGPEADDPLQLDQDCLRIAQDPAEKDPLLLTLAAINTTNWYRRVELYDRALALFPASGHRAYPRLFAQVLRMGESRYDYDQLGPLHGQALQSLQQCFSDGSFGPADQQEIALILVDGWGATFFARNQRAICELVAQAGPEYHWLELVLAGQAQVNEAWAARGGGYINTVSAQGYATFQQDLAAADASLTAAWKLHPDYPLAAAVGVYAALGSGLEESRRWFDRAVAAQIDQPLAWRNLRWALRPRWYGSTAAELALGHTALATGRFDTDVPRKLFDCVDDFEAETSHPPGRHLYGRPNIWPDLQRMYDGYVAAPAQAKQRPGWRASYAIVAYFGGHYDVAAAQLQAINWTLPARSLTTWGTDLSTMPLEVAARVSPVGKEVASAEAARASGNRAEALRRFTALAKTHAGDGRTQEFIHFRLAHLTEEQHLEDGRWMSLIPRSDHDPDWVYQLGEAHRTSAGDLEVEFGAKGHLLYPKVQVGPDFEVRGSFEVIRSSNTNFQGGIVIGLPDFDRDLNGNNWWGFRLKRHDEEGDIVTFGEGWTLRENAQRVPLKDKLNTFDLVVSDDRYTATVNGERVVTDAEVPSELGIPENTYFVGLGAYSDSADAVVRYHGVEVRKLALTEDALNADAPKGAQPEVDPESDEPVAPKAAVVVAPLHPGLPVADQVAADTLELNQATDRVKEIVNRPAPHVAPKDGMNITWWDGGWFHPGAEVPDYATVDVSKTRENPYFDYAYVGSNAHPDMVFPGRELEFNAMTKLYYTDRTLPKRRLTRAEMAEINQLYRRIGACQADLARLNPPAAKP